MNKKLLIAVIGTALVAGPAFAAKPKVKVYGKMEQEKVFLDSDSVGDFTEQGDRNGRSRWGVKVSKDLGNGMKAIANFEFNLAGTATTGSSPGTRVQIVGIQGGFGKLVFGRNHGAYKTCGGVKWDPYTATFLQARRNGGMSGGSLGTNGFRNKLIDYTTPKIGGGLTVQFQYVQDEASGADGEYAVCGKFKGGPLELIAAANNSEPNGTQSTKLGARIGFGGAWKLACQWEDVEHGGDIRVNGNKTGTKTTNGTFTWCNLGFKPGNTLFAVSVGQFDDDVANGDTDYLAIGATHFINKGFRVYGGYTNVDSSDTGETTMFGVGIRFDF